MRKLLADVGKTPSQVENEIERANTFARNVVAMKTTVMPSTPEPTSTPSQPRSWVLEARPPANIETTVSPTESPIRTTVEETAEPPKTGLWGRWKDITSTTSTAHLSVPGIPSMLMLAGALLHSLV
ncbi:unnamed protein product [Schistocephalus solidus]|uniref:GPI anchored protein n=1 Tax=Schistocephalus solidus TaxID=70667 RepID=A0A183TRV3_SCHSO|nr:unnamed protein product [Schistocephalus solidus]